MRIGISLLDFQPGNSGGIETYCRDLIDGIQMRDSKNEYYILLNIHNKGQVRVTATNMQVVYCDKRSAIHKVQGKLGRSILNETLIVNTINKFGIDILHIPLQTIQDYLLPLPVKKIVSIMDVQQEYFPKFFEKKDLENRRHAYKQSCDAADCVISISDYTKKSLIEKLGINPKKITTVYLNYNEDIFGKATKEKRITESKYFYFPAATWPHKNHMRLLQAFKKFLNDYPEYKLVMNGVTKQKSREIVDYIKSNNLDSSVLQLGYIEDIDKPSMFGNAFALIFPSLFEGFGIPVVEAMASSCPVICSNTTSLPEVGGNAVLYCDPLSVDDISNKMIELVNDDRLRQELIRKGRVQATKFTKASMVANTLKVYKKVAKM